MTLHRSGRDCDRMTASTSAAVGMSYDTLTMVSEVVEAAADKTLPPKVREVTKEAVKEMDEARKVSEPDSTRSTPTRNSSDNTSLQ